MYLGAWLFYHLIILTFKFYIKKTFYLITCLNMIEYSLFNLSLATKYTCICRYITPLHSIIEQKNNVLKYQHGNISLRKLHVNMAEVLFTSLENIWHSSWYVEAVRCISFSSIQVTTIKLSTHKADWSTHKAIRTSLNQSPNCKYH